MNPNIRSTLRAAAPLLTLLLPPLAACDRETGPIEVGRYEYRAAHPTPGGDTIRIEGVLNVEEVRGDTIEGVWEVPQLHPELRVVDDADGRLTVSAQPTYFGTIYHRIGRSGRGVTCSAEYVWVAEGGVERSEPVTCAITRDPGATPLPGAGDPETPIVRPIQDTTPR